MKKEKYIHYFLIWGVACLLANLFCTNAAAFGGDQGYWENWVRQLAKNGLEHFDGNYPPLYIFWLWIVAQVHNLFNVPIEKGTLLKFLCLWPIYFGHVALVDFASRMAARFKLQKQDAHLVLAFVALNPALLLDGPVWGQVDLFPCILGIAALYCINFKGLYKYAAMFFALALLAKFQMIVLLPVFGGIFIRRCKKSWKGLPLMAVAVALVFVPLIVAGNLSGMLTHAYLNTTEQYPFSTYNAANIWMFFVGNTSRDVNPLFGLSPEGIGFLLSPSWIGKILFVIVSAYIFKCALFTKNLRRTFELVTWEAFAFFLLLPGMHERYLVYAIPFACVWMVIETRKAWFWSVLLTAICAMNISMINGFKGADLWTYVSGLAILCFIAAVVKNFAPGFARFVAEKLKRIPFPRFTPYVMLALFLVPMLFDEILEHMPLDVELKSNQFFLTDLPIERFTQQYKTPKIGRAVDGNVLSVKGRQYANGIGTHANSELYFRLPQNADSLEFVVAIDDESGGGGSVRFSVCTPTETLWTSSVIYGNKKPQAGKIYVGGEGLIYLKADADGDNSYDHADWLNVVVTTRE